MAARRFLYIIAGLVALAVVLAVAYKAFEPALLRATLVPGMTFETDTRDAAPDYAKLENWAAHPKLTKSPALDAPAGYRAAPKPAADVFYVIPTTYIEKAHWNAPLANPGARDLQAVFLRNQASAFNAVGSIWSPRYRQATFGAFLSQNANGAQAINLAYTDVQASFDAFLRLRDPARPVLLVGHSQGALHVLRLLKDRVAGRPVQNKLVAAYIIGWPVSVEGDLAPLGLDACQTPSAVGCVISWLSFGPEADLVATAKQFTPVPTLSGKSRVGTKQLCVNPLNFWAATDPVDKQLNLGALPFSATGKPIAALKPQLVGAQCDPSGFLLLSPPPGDPFDAQKMPGDNYHVYDMSLFWANIRANAEMRVENYLMPR